MDPDQAAGDRRAGRATRGASGRVPAMPGRARRPDRGPGWLRRVPGPGPMPSDVVARLDAALAGARREPPASSATVLPMRTERSTGWLGRIAESRATKSLVAAAAVGLIGIGGYAAINHTDSPPARRRGSAASAAGGAGKQSDASRGIDQAAAAVRASGTAYTKANIDHRR